MSFQRSGRKVKKAFDCTCSFSVKCMFLPTRLFLRCARVFVVSGNAVVKLCCAW